MRRCSMVDATVAKASTCRECQVRVCVWSGDGVVRQDRGIAAHTCRLGLPPPYVATCHLPRDRIAYITEFDARPPAFPPAQHIHAHPAAAQNLLRQKKSHQSSTPHTHTHTDTHTRTPLHYISHPTCLYIPYFELATSRQPDEQSPPTGPRTHFATHSVGAPP